MATLRTGVKSATLRLDSKGETISPFEHPPSLSRTESPGFSLLSIPTVISSNAIFHQED